MSRWILATACVLLGSLALAAEEAPDPPRPIIKRTASNDKARPAVIRLSDGTALRGELFLRGNRRLKIFDKERRLFREFPLRLVERIEVTPIKEEKLDEWRWLEHANDAKVKTGAFYWWRQYEAALTLLNQKTVTGAVRAPVYIRIDEPTRKAVFSDLEKQELKPEIARLAHVDGRNVLRLLLHDRDKGKLDEPLARLVYITAIEFDEPETAQTDADTLTETSRPEDESLESPE